MRVALGRSNAVKDNKVSSHARGWRFVCWSAFSVWAQQAISIWTVAQTVEVCSYDQPERGHLATWPLHNDIPEKEVSASSGPSQRTVNFWHCQYGFLYYTCLQITGCHVVHALLHVLFHRLLLYRSAAMWLCYYNSKKCYNDRKLSQFNKICSWRQNTSYSSTANMNRAWYCRLL